MAFVAFGDIEVGRLVPITTQAQRSGTALGIRCHQPSGGSVRRTHFRISRSVPRTATCPGPGSSTSRPPEGVENAS